MMNLWKGTVRRVGATLLACVLLLGLLPQLPRQPGSLYRLLFAADGGLGLYAGGYIGGTSDRTTPFRGRSL